MRIVLFVQITLLAATAARANTPPQFTPPQAAELVRIRTGIDALEENADAGIITRAQATQGTERYLAATKAAAGRALTRSELAAVPAPTATAVAPATLTALQRFAGLITFMNVLWVIAIVVGVISIVYFFGSIFVDLLKVLLEVPPIVYELLFYTGAVGLLVFGRTLRPEISPYVGLAGALLFAGAIVYSTVTRKLKSEPMRFCLILAIVWAIAALVYGSQMLGFITVMALLGALGFSAMMWPGVIALGFEDDDALGKATSAAFLILIGFCAARITADASPTLAIFEKGALFMGSFVGYLGLLVASSRWYEHKRYPYVLFQIVTVAAGIGAIAVGSIFGIGELQKIGGTFFVIYLLEKIIEIPAESARGYAFVGMLASGAIFAFCTYARLHPETIRPYFFIAFS